MFKNQLFILLFSVSLYADSSDYVKYTYKQPYPDAPIAYTAKDGRSVYVDVSEPKSIPEVPPVMLDIPEQVRWSIAVELGYHDFDTSKIGIEKIADKYANIIKSYGWSNVSGAHQLNLNNLFQEVSLNCELEQFEFGLGWRHYDFGNGQITVKGDASLPFAQYTTINEVQSIIASNVFVSSGIFEYLQPNTKLSFDVDLGYVIAESIDNFSWETYNGTYSNDKQNATINGDGYQCTLRLEVESLIAKHFKLGLNLGYKNMKIYNFKYTSISSDFYGAPKVNDNVYDYDGNLYSLDLSGFIGGLKLSYSF